MKITTVSLIAILLLGFGSCYLYSQDTLIFENFIKGILPTGWSEEKVSGDQFVHWQFQKGGHDLYPDTAATDTMNACFSWESYETQSTKLITAPVDLSSTSKPELRFWHAQKIWTWGGDYNDQLRVYYKKGADSAWVLLEEYILPVEEWNYRVIPIPDSAKSSVFYLAFEGKTQYGHGTCIDGVLLLETDIVPLYLDSYSINQASSKFVASGTNNNPILRIDMNVIGNTSTIQLQSLTVQSGCDNDGDITTNGVRLYYTEDTLFSRDNPISTPQPFSGGEATFSGINQYLSFGLNVIWVTFDIDSGITDNNYVDAYIDINDMTIGGSSYPSSVADPPGKRLIYNTIFFDDFEDDKGWVFTGEFQRNMPLGLGGTIEGNSQTVGNPDPDYAFSGDTIIGTDLTGLGAQLGNYELISDGTYRAILSLESDLYYYRDVKLSFQRYLNIHFTSRRAFIEVSNDSIQWNTVFNSWTMGGYFIDPTYIQKTYDISNYADGKDKVYIRFTLSNKYGGYITSGWNIDDVLITGDWVTKDVGVSDLFYPVYGCGFTSTEYPQVRVYNYGALPTSSPVPVRITFDGGQSVTDTIYSVIQSADYIDFTFTKPVDLSDSAVYTNVEVITLLEGDEDASLDGIITDVYSMPIYKLPYSQTFTSDPVFWRDDGNTHNLWDLNYPQKYVIIDTANRCWSTRYNGSYSNNDSNWVESPCFDFSTVQKPIFECRIWKEIDTLYNGDGAVLQYSINDGATWNLVPSHSYSWDWNWYNNPDIPTLGSEGWDGSSGGWITAKQFLPAAVAGQSSVKFRVFWKTDTANTDDGLAFDDIKIYEAPYDVGVASIDSILNNQCQYYNSPYLWVTVENYGLLDIPTGTEIIVGLDENGRAPIIDTFTLASTLPVGSSVPLHFTKPISLADTGNYTIVAYTLIEDDPYFYETYNDTAIHTFSVKPAPVHGLPKVIYTVEPDTVTLEPNYSPSYSYYWHYNGSTDSIFDVPGAGYYGYTIANGTNGCSVTDSVHVVQLVPDLGADDLLLPVAACELSPSETIMARIINLGTDTFTPGRQIVMSYRIEERPFVSEIVTLTDTIAPGDSLEYTFITGADLSTPGMIYDVYIVVSYSLDMVNSNDTLKDEQAISYGYPDPALGQDRAVIDTSYTLTTSSDYVSILWNDNTNDTLNSFTIKESGSYWVEVMDTLGCPGYDTVYIFLKVRDLEMVRTTNPSDTCFSGFSEPIRVLIRNTGSDTIVPGEMVNLEYSINSGAAQVGTFTAGNYYYPNDSFEFTFPQTQVFNVNTYNIETSIDESGDFYPENNGYTTIYSIYANPVVNLGDDVDGVLAPYYVLDAGAGTGYNYLWWDGTSDQTYTVTATTSGRDHYVVVTDTNGCQGKDTANIYILVNDMAVTNAYIVDSICLSILKEDVYVQIQNAGNLNVLPNDTIEIGYILNGYRHVEYFILPNGLDAFQTQNYIFQGINNGIEGQNYINFIVGYDDDVNPPNDTLVQEVFVRESPDVDFGQTDDTLKVNFPYTLDAGAGYISYEWQDFTLGQTYEVTAPGWYAVSVSNGICSDQFRVYVDQLVGNRADLSVPEILIYPNPARDQINIQINIEGKFPSDILIELINMEGKVVWKGKMEHGQKTTSINVQEFSEGLYFMRFYDHVNMFMEKIIIQ